MVSSDGGARLALTEVNKATEARAAMVPRPARKTKMMMAIQPAVFGLVRFVVRATDMEEEGLREWLNGQDRAFRSA